MQKYVGLAVGLAFAAYWIFKNIRRVKTTEIKSLPTGVSRWTYLIVALFFLLGPFILTIAAERLIDEVQHELNWVKSTGFVTEHVEAGKHKGRTTYRARFHYQTTPETGQVDHEVLDPVSQRNPPAISSAINVLYDPSNPDNAKINDPIDRWMVGSVMFAAGGFFIFFAAIAAIQIMKIQSLQSLARANASIVGTGHGTLTKTTKNFFLSLRHANSWRLIVEYTDLAGRKHTAHSEPIWKYDPSGWAKTEIPVPLVIERSNSSRAWVRVEEYFKLCQKS